MENETVLKYEEPLIEGIIDRRKSQSLQWMLLLIMKLLGAIVLLLN
jgi:hypothetical protein